MWHSGLSIDYALSTLCSPPAHVYHQPAFASPQSILALARSWRSVQMTMAHTLKRCMTRKCYVRFTSGGEGSALLAAHDLLYFGNNLPVLCMYALYSSPKSSIIICSSLGMRRARTTIETTSKAIKNQRAQN